jgi:regulator of RNase E activity RraA
VADYDGVVVVPRAVAEEVLRLAEQKVARENDSRADLARGVYLRDVYKKYGVL